MALCLNEIRAWRQVFHVGAVPIGNEYLRAVGAEYYAATPRATEVAQMVLRLGISIDIDCVFGWWFVGNVTHNV